MSSTHPCFESTAQIRPAPRASLARARRNGCRMLALWHSRHSERRVLAALTAEQLRDIGVSAGDAAHEASKPFWRP